MQSSCTACRGAGQSYQLKRIEEELDLYIPRGAPDGHKCKFSNKADERPDTDTGDVLVVLKEKPHPVFRKRKGADLYLQKKISLTQAITGVDFRVKYLDGEILRISML